MDHNTRPAWNNIKSNINATQGGKIHIGTHQTAQIINNNVTIQAPAPATALPKVWGTPPLNNLSFFNRRLRQNIKEKIATTTGEKTRYGLFVLAGLGGVGKTELAKDYFYHHEKNYTAKLWFNAENREHLESEYRWLAQELFLVEEKADIMLVVRKIHAFLAEHPGWLIVLDNADDAAAIQTLLPAQGGDILITSRQPTWSGIIIDVGNLELEEAVSFYKFYHMERQTDDEEIVKELVKTLGYLPLAIAQAAAYIQAEFTNAAQYLEDFNRYKKQILSINSLPSTHTNEHQDRLTIMTTWNLSLDAIERQSSATEKMPSCSRDLLKACAYLASRNIPHILLTKWLEARYPNQEVKFILINTLRQLKSHSLIQSDEQFVHIHSLIQEVMRIICDTEPTFLREIAHSLMTVFDMCFDNKVFNWLPQHLGAVINYAEKKFSTPSDMLIVSNIYKMWAGLMKHLTFEHFETIEKYKKSYQFVAIVPPEMKVEEIYIRYNIALLSKIISINYEDILSEFNNMYSEYMSIKKHVINKKQYDFLEHKIKREIGSTKYYIWYYLGSPVGNESEQDLKSSLEGFKEEGGVECLEQIKTLYDLGGMLKQFAQNCDESKIRESKDFYETGLALAKKCHADDPLNKERFHIPNFYTQLAHCYWMLNSPEKMNEMFELASQTATEFCGELSFQHAYYLFEKSNYLLCENILPEANHVIQQCINVLSNDKLRKTYKKMLARSYMTEGLINIFMRNFDSAELSLNKAIIIFNEYNFPIVTQLCYLYLYCLYCANNKPDKIDETFSRIQDRIKFSDKHEKISGIEMLKKFDEFNKEKNGFNIHPNFIENMDKVLLTACAIKNVNINKLQ